MIDFNLLCRAIDDWRAGHRPGSSVYANAGHVSTAASLDEEIEYEAIPTHELDPGSMQATDLSATDLEVQDDD